MIAVDTNILVYAHRQDSPFHEKAKQKIKALAEGAKIWGIPWPCVYEFYAIVTHPRIYVPPSTSKQALEQLDSWFESPTVTLLSESADQWLHVKNVIAKGNVQGPLIHDAKIAALCMAHQIETLWTADRDFSRFSGVKTTNPLV